MKRLNLYVILSEIIPTFSVGQIRGSITQDCAILRKGVDLPSINSSLGHWDSWSIDIYSPVSPANVDNIVEQIKNSLTVECEIETLSTGDYYDDVLRAFSTTITIRTPITY